MFGRREGLWLDSVGVGKPPDFVGFRLSMALNGVQRRATAY